MGLVWMGGGAARETPATLLNSKHNGLQHVKWPQLNSTSTRSSRQARTRVLQQLTRTAASLVHHFTVLNKSHPLTSLKTVTYSAAFAALLLPAFCHSFPIPHSPPPPLPNPGSWGVQVIFRGEKMLNYLSGEPRCRYFQWMKSTQDLAQPDEIQ